MNIAFIVEPLLLKDFNDIIFAKIFTLDMLFNSAY